MNKDKKKDSYTSNFIEYEDKQYLPGYYVGAKLPLALIAKTKTGGYFLLVVGLVLLLFYLYQLIHNFTIENILWLLPVLVALLVIFVGIKFIKLN